MGAKREPSRDLILWIDTETSGLDPASDDLLEVAVLITNNELRELDSRSCVVSPSSPLAEVVDAMDPVVLEMHTRNGLLSALHAGEGRPASVVDEELSRWLRTSAGAGPFLLGGNSITLDRNFLAVGSPRLFGMLHHRSIDVTSVHEDLRRDGFAREVDLLRSQLPRTDAHRALGDIRDSVRELRVLRSLRRGVPLEKALHEHGAAAA